MKHPISMKIRTALRNSVEQYVKSQGIETEKPLFLVALSGGADSLALASALAAESKRNGSKLTGGAVIVEHGLQEATVEVAEKTAQRARQMGLSPVMIIPVSITDDGEGAEGNARNARYEAFEQAMAQTGAAGILIGHTQNDQAEQVLLGAARGSGTRSLSGIAEFRSHYIRPMLGISRNETEQSCHEMNISYWVDPHNSSNEYARVRVRQNIIPIMQAELGDSIVSNLANTAKIAREDADALDYVVDGMFDSIVQNNEDTVTISNVKNFSNIPVAIRSRVFRKIAQEYFGSTLESSHCESINKLITQWNGQKPMNLPGMTVSRLSGGIIEFK